MCSFMPWIPRYEEAQLRTAIDAAASWRDVLVAIGHEYHGKNISTARKWAQRWHIQTDHLPDRRARTARYTSEELATAIAASRSWAETLRRLGYCSTGGNWKTLKKRAAELGLSTAHFDPYARSRERSRRERTPLAAILIEHSTYSRSALKQRLYEEGLRQPRCELCRQGTTWQGKCMGLILDHANGVRDDNRLENLRIVCPNCAATLETHCGRKNLHPFTPVDCLHCGGRFTPKTGTQRYCSRACGSRWDRAGIKRPGARKIERPSHLGLVRDVEELGYRAVGRKYGVSDNAVRKWLREYEREQAISEGRDPSVVEIPRRTWPNQRREGRRSETEPQRLSGPSGEGG
jgi:transposase-like protein